MKRSIQLYISTTFVILLISFQVSDSQERLNPRIITTEPRIVPHGQDLKISFQTDRNIPQNSDISLEIDDKKTDFIIESPGNKIVVPNLLVPESDPINGEYLRKAIITINNERSTPFPFRQPARYKPMISSITPFRISYGDTITIIGEFKSNQSQNELQVKIDGQSQEYFIIKPDKTIEVLVLMPTDTLKPIPTKKGEYEREVIVSVNGVNSNCYLIRQVTWKAIFQPKGILAVSLYVITLIILLVVGCKKANGNNNGKKSKNACLGIIKSETGEFSLSKAQMALWTLIFSAFYVILSTIYGRFLDITEGMFWLMGISSATGVGAIAIAIKNADPKNQPSKFLMDYDSRSGKYKLSLHRFQIALWTVIVAIVYCTRVINTMNLMDIPGNLLILMGISGGTYLGFKFPKKDEDPGQQDKNSSDDNKTLPKSSDIKNGSIAEKILRWLTSK